MTRRLPSGMSVRLLKCGTVKLRDPGPGIVLFLSPKEVEGVAAILWSIVLEKYEARRKR